MTPEHQKVYDRLRASLKANLHAIDDELIQLPSQLMEASDIAVALSTEKEISEYEHAVARSDAGNEMRVPNAEGKKISETQIAADLPTHPKVYDAWVAVRSCAEDLARFNKLISALEIKKSTLVKLCDLVLSGWTAASKESYQSNRQAMSAARQESAPTRRAKPEGAF
jgi:hypothetical protein